MQVSTTRFISNVTLFRSSMECVVVLPDLRAYGNSILQQHLYRLYMGSICRPAQRPSLPFSIYFFETVVGDDPANFRGMHTPMPFRHEYHVAYGLDVDSVWH